MIYVAVKKDAAVQLCWAKTHLVEDPDLPIHCWPGDTMAVVVEKNPLFLGVAPQGRTQLLHFVHRRVQALLVPGLGTRKGKINFEL